MATLFVCVCVREREKRERERKRNRKSKREIIIEVTHKILASHCNVYR